MRQCQVEHANAVMTLMGHRSIQCELLTPPAAPYVHEEQLDEVEHDDDYMDVDYDPSADFDDEEEDEDDRIDESDDEYVL